MKEETTRELMGKCKDLDREYREAKRCINNEYDFPQLNDASDDGRCPQSRRESSASGGGKPAVIPMDDHNQTNTIFHYTKNEV